jgi:hypothetical protein
MCCRNIRVIAWSFVGALAMVLMARSAQAEIEFGIPTPMPEPFNVGGAYGYPWLTEDGLDIYFTSDRSDPFSPGSGGILTSHRDLLSDPWGPFVDLGAPVNTLDRAEFAQSLTADGQEMYFMRALSPFGLPEGDLFVTKRQPDDTWGVPQPLEELNTSEREAGPTISPDGKTLYFNSFGNPNYPSPNGLAISTWVATRSSRADTFDNPEFFFDGYGTVTSDGLTHIIGDYPDFAEFYGVPNVGDQDLYVRTRKSTDEEYGPVQFLQPPVNGSGQFLPPGLTGVGLECCAFFSASDSTLYFTSIRPGTDATGSIGFVDLWQAPLAEAVPVDIKPGSTPSPINLKSKGVLPVAILSTEEFDATQVDVETLLFGDPLLIADGKLPVGALRGNIEDVDQDGLDDLTLKFSMRDLIDNEVIGAATVQGYLAGQLVDGTEIAGRDMVRIVPALKSIPEPSSLLLILVGVLALANCRRS